MPITPISYEFFPPKTLAGKKLLSETVSKLETISPDFFSVTFGAGGSTREGTVETVTNLQSCQTPIAPHLACVGMTKNEIIAILNTYKTLKIKRIIAIRGDLPSGMGHSGELKFAMELVMLIRQVLGDDVYIEVAAYPEVHPQASDAERDIFYLKKKMDAGANGAITQYFFNPDAYFYFRDACQQHGITQPLIPGIMPITHFAKLIRFSDMCGAEIPRWIRKKLEAFHDDKESIQAFGLDVVYHLCNTLLRGGAPGLHFYTLNQAEASMKLHTLLNQG